MSYYTYLWLRDDGTPYYVGKGSWKRAHRQGCPPVERIILQEWPSEVDAFAAEIFLIAYYGRKDLGTGILRNMTDGGEGIAGQVFSEEHRRKIGESNRRVPRRPRIHPVVQSLPLGSPELRAKLSRLAKERGSVPPRQTEETLRRNGLLTKGRPKSEEHRRHISESKLGKSRPTFSAEWIDRMRTAQKGVPKSPEVIARRIGKKRGPYKKRASQQIPPLPNP